MPVVTSRAQRWSQRRKRIGRLSRRYVVAPVPRPAADVYAELDRERRRNAELERRVAELSRSVQDLEAFSREISHDLKAPLAGICGYAQLLTHLDVGYPRPVDYDDFVAEINRGTDRMRRLIDDVLAYSTVRGAGLHLTTIDLSALVDDVVADRAVELPRPGAGPRPAPHITWETLPAVRGDHGMLRRLLENLLGNALKYVRPGEAARVHISARTSGGVVRVEVTDQGIGIPDGQHEAIFGELHRAHPDAYPGTGLGLSICRRIVHRLGGAIGADPRFRGGARIWFTLPAAVSTGAGQVSVAADLAH
ncbi:sensor histidine kinase [Pseudosporangium ferrugineum]|uniref:Sensor-like histidine kinase SenX3 n=1 Tax=Pseudosporangium ferrugineum TaxID=439699 RepID=A0A2T0SFN6_9ACTN|nr:HAMP domain-containing sensor histidine kinase [Pseudosporangium ferrugineum]PRY32163.1 phospho-acceptor domain-containing protein [Pseudosporangium ferrugineum]